MTRAFQDLRLGMPGTNLAPSMWADCGIGDNALDSVFPSLRLEPLRFKPQQKDLIQPRAAPQHLVNRIERPRHYWIFTERYVGYAERLSAIVIRPRSEEHTSELQSTHVIS